VLVAHPGSDSAGALFLVLLTCDQRGRVAEVLGADRRVHRLAAAEIDAWLDDEQRGPAGRPSPVLLRPWASRLAMKRRPPDSRRRGRAQPGGGGLGATPGCQQPGRTLCPGRGQARGGHCAGIVSGGLCAHGGLVVVAWGRGAAGPSGTGLALAWACCLLTFVACRGSGVWAAGRLAVQVGGLVRERLLEGILRLPADQVRVKGVGNLLGTVLEADALDAFARTGGPLLLADVFQFLFGAVCCCWARRRFCTSRCWSAGCSWPPDWCAACIDDCSDWPTHACYSPTSW